MTNPGIEESYLDQLLSYFASGGAVMIPLVILAAALWYALGYRFIVLKRGNVRSVRRLISKYQRGYDRAPTGIVDQSVVEGLAELETPLPNLRRRLDDLFAIRVVEMGRFATMVRSIVAVAPLLGLLGTVAGMIETFDSLGDMSLFSQSGGIAGGISLALFTTQMGLAVAIPGLLIGRVLENRQRTLEREIDKIKDILCAMEGRGSIPEEVSP